MSRSTLQNKGALAYLIKDEKWEEEGGDGVIQMVERKRRRKRRREWFSVLLTHLSFPPPVSLSLLFLLFCSRHRSFLLPTGEKKKPLGVPTKQLLRGGGELARFVI